jgi:hypothetical protein
MPATIFLVARLHADLDAVRGLPRKIRVVGLELDRIDNAATTGS